MGPVTAKITIDAPRERVWELVSDLAVRPAFCDHFLEQYHLQRIGSTGIGAAARFHVDAPRFAIWMESVVSELEAPHRMIERGRGARSDRMPIGIGWELIEGPGDVTELTVSFWTEPSHPLDKLKEKFGAARWYRRQWKRAAKRLREVVEADVDVEPLQVAGESRL